MTDTKLASRVEPGASFLLISSHDYRSKRKANVHFIIRELARHGKARFFSIGFSALSLLKSDPRSSLWSRANYIESHEGIDCYLWRTLLHPINLRRSWLAPLERLGFKTYMHFAAPVLKRWIMESGTIV